MMQGVRKIDAAVERRTHRIGKESLTTLDLETVVALSSSLLAQ